MSITSIKQAIETIEETASDFFADELIYARFQKDQFTEKDKDFPAMQFYYADGGLSFGQNANQLGLVLKFADQISGQNNKDSYRKEVVSDMFNIASRFIDKLERPKGLQFTTDVPTVFFDMSGKDGLGGVEVTITIFIAKPC